MKTQGGTGQVEDVPPDEAGGDASAACSPPSESPARRRRLQSGSRAAVDPEYNLEQPAAKMQKIEREAREKVAEKVVRVVQAEFGKAIDEKETELDILDERLLQVQKALHLVRYVTVTNYYSQSVPKQTSSQPENVVIHPAVRKLLSGKEPSAGAVAAAGLGDGGATTRASESAAVDAEAAHRIGALVLPEVLKPNVKDLGVAEPRGLQHKQKRRFIVGNVSKWIECDQRDDMSTHKWMLYVRGDKDQPDVSDVVSKVRFLIHPSYAPHDLVEVVKSPFHLTRRGWGEFPARIQIHFKEETRTKPIDVIHQLKLDKTYTGLQTLGAETVVEVWLHNREDRPKCEAAAVKAEPLELTSEGWVIAHSQDTDLRPFVESILSAADGPDPVANGVKVEPPAHMMIKEEPLTELCQKVPAEPVEEVEKPQVTYVCCTDRNGKKVFLPVALRSRAEKKQQSEEAVQARLTLAQGVIAQNESLLSSKAAAAAPRRLAPPPPSSSRGGVSLLLSSSASSSLPAGTSLLKKSAPGLANGLIPSAGADARPKALNLPIKTDLEKALPKVSLSSWRHIFGTSPHDSHQEIELRLLKRGGHLLKRNSELHRFLSAKVLDLCASSFPSEDSCIMYVARFFPLVTTMASDDVYAHLHPYAAVSEERFRAWNVGKQRASEWIRAQVVRRAMQVADGLRGIDKSTKYIMKLLRVHGYSVPLQISRNFPSPERSAAPVTLSSVEELLRDSISTATASDLHPVSLDDSEVDIVGDSPSKQPSLAAVKREERPAPLGPKARLTLPREDCLGSLTFVKSAAKEIGVYLEQEEELVPGVTYAAAQKLILRACKNFCDSAIRKSYKSAWDRVGRPPGEVGVVDVVNALSMNPELSILTNAGLGKHFQK